MELIKTSLPNTTGGFKRREATNDTLSIKLGTIRKIIEAYNKDTMPVISKELKLDAFEMEELIRRFKTVPFNTLSTPIDPKEWSAVIQENKHYQSTFRPWFFLLQSNVSYSAFSSVKQVKSPRYSVASSPMMLAAREAYNIPYSAWQEKISWHRLFPSSFSKVLQEVPETYDEFVVDEEFRHKYIKTPTSWYFIKQEHKTLEDIEFDKWHYYLKHMKMESWIFSPHIRDENSMIFHPRDWDYAPEVKPRFNFVDDGLKL